MHAHTYTHTIGPHYVSKASKGTEKEKGKSQKINHTERDS